MRRDGTLDRLDAEISERLGDFEREDGLVDGALRQGREPLPERYAALARRIRELAPLMGQWNIEVSEIATSGADSR